MPLWLRTDHIFFTFLGYPIVQDGLRDGEHIRQAMHARFEEELRRQPVPFVKLSGSHETRLEKAIRRIDNDPIDSRMASLE